jgi:hypothetical protein
MNAAPDWLELLRMRVATLGSISAVARELRYSRTAISLALAGKYPAKSTTQLAAAVIAACMPCSCPFLGREITAGECRLFRTRPIPQSRPDELRHWAVCQDCPIGARLAAAEAQRREKHVE